MKEVQLVAQMILHNCIMYNLITPRKNPVTILQGHDFLRLYVFKFKIVYDNSKKHGPLRIRNYDQ